MERISRFRAMLFLALFAFVLLLFSGRLFVLQIVETEGDTDNTEVYGTVTTVRAARGDILDRNGNVLVGNRASTTLSSPTPAATKPCTIWCRSARSWGSNIPTIFR